MPLQTSEPTARRQSLLRPKLYKQGAGIAGSVIHVGMCGFPKSRADAFSKVDAVEIQESFYRHIDLEAVKKWRREAPKGFIFSVKASQYVTHDPSSPTYRRSDVDMHENVPGRYGSFKMTREVMAAWRKTEEECRVLGAKAVVFQTPSSFRPVAENLDNMDKFLAKAETGMLRAWEPRGEWPPEVVAAVCSKHKVIHVVDPFGQDTVTKKVAYFRLHGKPPGRRNYYYSYGDAELKKLKDVSCEFDEAYVFFNNVSMLADAQRFRGILNVQG